MKGSMGKSNFQLLDLKNHRQAKLVHDVIVKPLKIFTDPRGSLAELLKTSWPDVYNSDTLPFSQTYVSWTNFNVARDEELFHYHPNGQQDRFIILKGKAVVLVYDQRQDSPTKGVLNLFLLDGLEKPDNCYMVVVPPRTLHGFLAVDREGTLLINFPTHLYDPKNEWRIKFTEKPLDSGDLFSWNEVRRLLKLPIPERPVTK